MTPANAKLNVRCGCRRACKYWKWLCIDRRTGSIAQRHTFRETVSKTEFNHHFDQLSALSEIKIIIVQLLSPQTPRCESGGPSTIVVLTHILQNSIIFYGIRSTRCGVSERFRRRIERQGRKKYKNNSSRHLAGGARVTKQ